MAEEWGRALERWVGAGLVDAATADRIRGFEAGREPPQRLRWPVRVAIAFGGLLLGAGVLLFVEANWQEISPAARFALVLALVGGFHVAGALTADRFGALASVLHAVGTASLGAGIFLAGQIFHLDEHWPGGFMLWAIGAWLGAALLRSWPQTAFAAVLTPVWLAGEWIVATEGQPGAERVLVAGLLLLAIVYFTAPTRGRSDSTRIALSWIGGIAIFPLAFAAATLGLRPPASTFGYGTLALALVPGVAVALTLHRRDAWTGALAAVWVFALLVVVAHSSPEEGVRAYLWYGVGALAMIAWGLRDARSERINLGVAAFAATVLAFYFASVWDRLGRATGLVVLGLLFLVLGAALERARRRLVARVAGSA